MFSALGINEHPHPLLGYFVSLVEMDSDKLLARIQPSENDEEDNTKEFSRILKAVEQRIAAMRGVGICWKINEAIDAIEISADIIIILLSRNVHHNELYYLVDAW